LGQDKFILVRVAGSIDTVFGPQQLGLHRIRLPEGAWTGLWLADNLSDEISVIGSLVI
jgi:hypothetical protein